MRLFLFLFTLFVHASASLAQFSTIGSSEPYTQNLGGTGIETVYVFNDLSGSSLEYSTDAGVVRFYRYTHSISDKELLTSSDILSRSSGGATTYTIQNLKDGSGYIAEADGIMTTVWVIDYSKHLPVLNQISVDRSTDECTVLRLLINKSDDLFFYATGGARNRVYRLYQIEYTTMEWNPKTKLFDSKIITKTPSDIGTETTADAPLSDTKFTIKGDQFARKFGIEKSLSTPIYTAVATQVYIEAEQIDETSETGVAENLGGSAPAEINFYGYGNEPTVFFYTWYIYKTTDMNNAIVRYTDKDIRFTFKEAGEYLVRLEVANKNSECISTSELDVSITDFKWEVPNILILDGTMQFKISYKSVLNFKCTIFNRWGNKIYEWTDPSQGWDGKHNGRYVTPGVYFYVMTAESGDGKKHQKAGDINVLRRK